MPRIYTGETQKPTQNKQEAGPAEHKKDGQKKPEKKEPGGE